MPLICLYSTKFRCSLISTIEVYLKNTKQFDNQGSLTDVMQSNIVDATLENIREFELGKRGSELTNAVTACTIS